MSSESLQNYIAWQNQRMAEDNHAAKMTKEAVSIQSARLSLISQAIGNETSLENLFALRRKNRHEEWKLNNIEKEYRRALLKVNTAQRHWQHQLDMMEDLRGVATLNQSSSHMKVHRVWRGIFWLIGETAFLSDAFKVAQILQKAYNHSQHRYKRDPRTVKYVSQLVTLLDDAYREKLQRGIGGHPDSDNL